MNRYEILERLGDGSFGEVTKARSLKTNEIVAIKKMKALYPSWEECLQLRELKSLRVLRHENVVQLKEVIRDKEELYFVFEYMQSSLHKVMRQHQRQVIHTHDESSATTIPPGWLTEPQIKSAMYQLFSGLAYMHKHGFFHRDIKPENLLCHDEILKIADLGQAREIRSRPPYTDYVSTRWYRSPELLLRFTTYNSPIDLWACGCILAELYLQAPLFAGSSEADQLCRICKILGSPTKENWPEAVTTVAQMQFKFPKCTPIPWKNVLPSYTSKAAIQLISELVQYDPSKRLTASQALQHRFFDQQVPRPVGLTPMMPAPVLVAPMPSLPLKAEHKAGSWVVSSPSPECSPTTSRRWRESSSALLPTSHADTLLASSRKNHDSGERTGMTRDKPSRLDDAKSSTHNVEGRSTLAKGHCTSETANANWLSARKWSSPEMEEDGEADGFDDKHAAKSDHKGSANECKRNSGDNPPQQRRSSGSLSFRSQETMLQDLLDEFLA